MPLILQTLLRQAYICSTRHLAIASVKMPSITNAPAMTREFQTTSELDTLNKEIKHKKKLFRLIEDEKTENRIDQDLTDEQLIGLHDAGLIIPNDHTPDMLVDGVRFCDLPIVNVKSSLNNTLMNLTDSKGRVLASTSCGCEGFRNVKKSTNVAAQATGLSLGKKAVKMGLDTVRVVIKGLGAGRLASLKGMQMAGVKMVSLTDNTPIKNNMNQKPRKAKKR